MPPTAAKKGSAPKAAPRERRSVSRHSTPASALTDPSAPPTPVRTTPTTTATAKPPLTETPYLNTPTSALLSEAPSIEQLIAATSAHGFDPATAKELHSLHDQIRDSVNKFMGRRGEICDRSMRQLVKKRKERIVVEREAEAAREAAKALKREGEREREREREESEKRRVKRIKEKEAEKPKEREKTLSRKRSHDEMEVDVDIEEEERVKRRESLPSVGAHGLARQDGVGVHEGMFCSFLLKIGESLCCVLAFIVLPGKRLLFHTRSVS